MLVIQIRVTWSSSSYRTFIFTRGSVIQQIKTTSFCPLFYFFFYSLLVFYHNGTLCHLSPMQMCIGFARSFYSSVALCLSSRAQDIVDAYRRYLSYFTFFFFLPRVIGLLCVKFFIFSSIASRRDICRVIIIH